MHQSNIGEMQDEYDFKRFTLGQGPLKEKRKILGSFLEKLLGDHKLESAHRRYCDQIKRRR